MGNRLAAAGRPSEKGIWVVAAERMKDAPEAAGQAPFSEEVSLPIHPPSFLPSSRNTNFEVHPRMLIFGNPFDRFVFALDAASSFQFASGGRRGAGAAGLRSRFPWSA